jgi:hypothetical protein
MAFWFYALAARFKAVSRAIYCNLVARNANALGCCASLPPSRPMHRCSSMSADMGLDDKRLGHQCVAKPIPGLADSFSTGDRWSVQMPTRGFHSMRDPFIAWKRASPRCQSRVFLRAHEKVLPRIPNSPWRFSLTPKAECSASV